MWIEIMLHKCVYIWILTGFYKAVVDLQNIKEPDINRIKISKVPDKTYVETGYTEKEWSRNFTVFKGITMILIKTKNFYCPIILFTVTIIKIYLFAPEYFFQ